MEQQKESSNIFGYPEVDNMVFGPIVHKNGEQKASEESGKVLDFDFDKEADHAVSAVAYVKEALRAYYRLRKKTVTDTTKTMLAELLLLGAGDDLLRNSSELVIKNNARLEELNAKIEKAEHQLTEEEQKTEDHLRTLNWKIRDGEKRLTALHEEMDRVEEALKQHDGKEIGEIERIPALAGAKKAYDWIFERVKDEALAARSFNCYLQGGRYQPDDVYIGKSEKYDATDAINEIGRDIGIGKVKRGKVTR